MAGLIANLSEVKLKTLSIRKKFESLLAEFRGDWRQHTFKGTPF